MTVPIALHLIPLAGFTGIMATSAIEDLRRLIIPNGLIVGLCVLWPLYVATAPMLTMAAAGFAVLCAAAVFLAGALLFARGLIGGGDVKLLAALRPTLRDPSSDPSHRADRVLVPYGVAISAASLIVTIPPNFN